MKGFLSIALVFLTSGIIILNINSIKRMAIDPQVINEYVNDAYSVCAYVGTVAHQNQQIYIYSPDRNAFCAPDPIDGWYYGGIHPVIHNLIDQSISPNLLLPGDLVVFSTINRGLSSQEISQLINLGIEMNSLPSLQFSRNFTGKITAASICIHCDEQAPTE